MSAAIPSRRPRDRRVRGRRIRQLLAIRISGIHPAVPAEVVGNILYHSNAAAHLTPRGASWLLNCHPLGVVRQRVRTGGQYLVVTGLRSWQLLEALRHSHTPPPRVVAVKVLPAMSDEELRTLALADLLLSSLYFATAKTIPTGQMVDIARMLGSEAMQDYLTSAARLTVLIPETTPRKRGRPRKKPA